jgi:hypothetical protein
MITTEKGGVGEWSEEHSMVWEIDILPVAWSGASELALCLRKGKRKRIEERISAIESLSRWLLTSHSLVDLPAIPPYNRSPCFMS